MFDDILGKPEKEKYEKIKLGEKNPCKEVQLKEPPFEDEPEEEVETPKTPMPQKIIEEEDDDDGLDIWSTDAEEESEDGIELWDTEEEDEIEEDECNGC